MTAITITVLDHSLSASPSVHDGSVGTAPSPLLPCSPSPLPGHTEWTRALPGAWHFRIKFVEEKFSSLLKEGQDTESRPQCVPSGSCPSPPPERGCGGT